MGRATSRWAPSATPSASTSRNNLSESLKSEWRASKVRKLASVMVDEILERGREGMDCFVAGVCPLEFWPELLAAAAEIARKETGRPYEIAFPPDLPPLQPLNEGEDAPKVGEFEVHHPSVQRRAGPLHVGLPPQAAGRGALVGAHPSAARGENLHNRVQFFCRRIA